MVMKLQIGPVPASTDFNPDSSWKPMQEPTPLSIQLFATPVGVILFIAIGTLWMFLTPVKDQPFIPMLPVWQVLTTFALLIIVHELIHAAVHPRSGKYDDSVIGFWPSRLLFYAHYHGQLTRNRFAAILAMPTLVISLLPLIFSAVTRSGSHLIALISTWNALFACGDMLGLMLLLYQVPSKAVVRNCAWRTFWKIPDFNTSMT